MKKEVKVGLFAILMLLIGWGVIRVLKGADLFGNTNTYYAYYEQVGGLQEASQVMLYGVKIGSVTKVTLSEDPTKGVELTMEIEKRYQLPVDSKAKIFNNGLMGGKAVEIIYGQSSEMLSDEGVLQPEVTVDLMEMASSEMEGLITKVTTIMDNLTQTLEGINGLMAQNTQSITSIVSNVDGVTGNVNAMLAKERTHLEEALESLSKFSKSLGENTDEIDSIVKNMDTFSSQLASSNLIAEVEGAVAQLNAVLASVNDKNGSVGKLLSDD
ncbi:MAG: MCE family protein, partial [Alistipes sp.]|nr:MCE family protein [Alistipes sp.]